MKAIRLTHDIDIKKAYITPEPNTSLYFREGDEGDYELVEGHTLDTILDATCHGFEFISIEGASDKIVKVDDLEFEENEREI